MLTHLQVKFIIHPGLWVDILPYNNVVLPWVFPSEGIVAQLRPLPKHSSIQVKLLFLQTLLLPFTINKYIRNIIQMSLRPLLCIILKFLYSCIEISLTSRTCWSRPHIREKSLALDTNCPAFWKINTFCCCIVHFTHQYIIIVLIQCNLWWNLYLGLSPF